MIRRASGLQRGHWYGWIFWGVAATFFLYEFFVRVMPSVILEGLATEFDASPVDISTSISTYLWVYAPMQLAVGGLFDRFGAKFLLVGAAAIVGGGCMVFAATTGLTGLAISRAMAGAGSAFAFVGAIYVATVWFPPKRLALIAGITSGVGIMGEVIGQTPLALAVAKWGWQDVAWAAGAIGLLVAALMLILVPRRPAWFHERFADEDAVRSGFVRGTVAVLSNWRLWIVGIVSAAMYTPLSVVAALWGDTFMSTAGGYTTEEASFATIVLAVGWMIGSPLFGMVSDKIGSRRLPLMVGSIGGGLSMVAFLWPELIGWYGLLSVLFIGGFVTGTQVICFAVAMELSPKHLRATAAACCNFLTMLVAAGIQVAIGWILTAEVMAPNVHRTAGHAVQATAMLKDATPTEFRWAMAVVPALFVVSAILCFLLPETAPGTARVREVGSATR